MTGRLIVLLPLLCLAAVSATAGEYRGRAVSDVIDAFRLEGYAFVYSTSLVSPEVVVLDEPAAADPVDIVAEIVAPYGLAVVEDAGAYLVTRAAQPGDNGPVAANPAATKPAAIDTVTVAASRYDIGREISSSRFLLGRRDIVALPDVGEDPLRATHRLPGTAASGVSAKANIRGGNTDETGIFLNGVRLMDPYHVRDYQSIFSVVDARALSTSEIYTSAFPVLYGDHMSGVVLLESLDPAEAARTELGLSVFNTSLLTSGNSAGAGWLLSARRGNLDLVIDPEYGKPSYYDVLAAYTYDLTSSTSISANALFADDSVSVVLEAEPDEREESTSSTRNAQFWLRLDTRWNEQLAMSTLVSLADYANQRDAHTDDEEKVVAVVAERRDVREWSVRQDWSWRPTDRHSIQWGVEARYGDADYDYAGSADYFGLPALYPGQPESVRRRVVASPAGGAYAAYVADRWKFGESTFLEWGLRWDDQTYTDLASDAQLSPRVSLFRRLGPRTDVRLSWGRYHQAQQLNHLQVQDGIDEFWPAQRADHLVASVQFRRSPETLFRFEAFSKRMHDLRPRFENLYDVLALVPELQPDRVRLEASRAASHGLEVSFEHAAGPWRAFGSYTLSRSTDTIDGRRVARSWDQRHAVQAGLRFAGASWDLAAALGAHSGWPMTDLDLVISGEDQDGEPDIAVMPGVRNALRNDWFFSLDVRASRRFEFSRGVLTLFAEISNATNRDNICCYDYDLLDGDDPGNPILERSEDYWLPLLPAAGVRWEF